MFLLPRLSKDTGIEARGDILLFTYNLYSVILFDSDTCFLLGQVAIDSAY